MSNFRYQSDNLIEVRGPVNEGGDPPSAITNPSTVIARIFNDRKDSSLADTYLSGVTQVQVTDADRYSIGDHLWVFLDEPPDGGNSLGWFDCNLITAIDYVTGLIDFTTALNKNASKGRRTSLQLGTFIDCSTPFNVPNAEVGNYDWGFRGVVASDHADIRVGMALRIEIEFNGGADLNRTDIIKTTVAGGV